MAAALLPTIRTARIVALAAPLEKSGYGLYPRQLLDQDGVLSNDL